MDTRRFSCRTFSCHPDASLRYYHASHHLRSRPVIYCDSNVSKSMAESTVHNWKVLHPPACVFGTGPIGIQTRDVWLCFFELGVREDERMEDHKQQLG